jgi:membrane protein implicated in regulation of membrane protease activity
MSSYFVSLGHWNWFILGAVLLAIEIMAPGSFMLWFGLSAIAVGLISLAIVWPWQAQLITFAVLSLVSLIVWRRFGRKVDDTSDQPFLNRRAQEFVGRIFTLEKPIEDGAGSVRVGDTVWRVSGPDTPAGSRVKVLRTDGGTLVVDRTVE